MRRSAQRLLIKLLAWQSAHAKGPYFLYGASVAAGLLAGLAAIMMKNGAHAFQHFLESSGLRWHYVHVALPLVGLALVALLVRYVLGQPVGHGIPKVLYAIARQDAKLPRGSIYASWITSMVTVGFGGSVGLEGPSASTGAAIGSNLGQWLRLDYKPTLMLLACGATGAIAAIFNTPVAAIVFSLEVLMLDLSLSSMIPLLLASVAGTSLSYLLLGQQTIWAFDRYAQFDMAHLPFYMGLGLFTGLVSVYFTKVYIAIEDYFEAVKSTVTRLLLGGAGLGVLVLVLPYLYGEGYGIINECLHGKIGFLLEAPIYQNFPDSPPVVLLLLFMLLVFKPIASSITFGGGGVGGIFAPSLFVGAIAGMFFSYGLNATGLFAPLSPSQFALVGMAGVMSGVLHGPLTAIFLIADVTGGYGFIVPIMLVSSVSYATNKYFVSNSVYTHELAKSNQLLTHDKDKSVLSLMRVESLLETDFAVLRPTDTLGKLVEHLMRSKRNLFPVVQEDGTLVGIIGLNDVRHIMFERERYDSTLVQELMFVPEIAVEITDSVEHIARRFHETGRYNIPVLQKGKYQGFVSRANVFATYQKMLRQYSAS